MTFFFLLVEQINHWKTIWPVWNMSKFYGLSLGNEIEINWKKKKIIEKKNGKFLSNYL